MKDIARSLARRIPGSVAVLFYGSNLRSRRLDGVLDFYVLTDRPRHLADRILAPTIRFMHLDGLRAKVAIMPLSAFAASMRPQALSPHLWARFCQPAELAWVLDDQVAARVKQALDEALGAARWWAERLSPPAATPLEAWTVLFAHTYGAELRAESADRPAQLVQAAPEYWEALPMNPVEDAERRAARRSWAWRRPLSRVLTALRLVKAAFTVTGGADYVVWKIERHTGRIVELAPWQRRHPLLAALPMLVKLRRDGLIR